MKKILITLVLAPIVSSLYAQNSSNLASLIPAARVIVVAEITTTDYSQTASDGPMTAGARVLSSLKGGLKKDQSFRFTETAWVGPHYKAGEVRLLFLESAGNSWRILSNLYAKSDFFVAREAVPRLNSRSLKTLLQRMSPTASPTLITPEMIK